jgi:hypothetical protein
MVTHTKHVVMFTSIRSFCVCVLLGTEQEKLLWVVSLQSVVRLLVCIFWVKWWDLLHDDVLVHVCHR